MSVDKRFWFEYLHKRDKEPIFDVLRRKYFYSRTLTRWKLTEEGKLLLEVALNKGGKKLNIELFFIGPKALVLRAFTSQLKPFETELLLTKIVLERVKATLSETDDSLVFSSGEINCIIKKEPWSLKLSDSQGKVFLEEYADGLLRGFFPVYPLGYKVVGGKRRFFESMKLSPNEAIYGFGEKFGSLEKRGQNLTIWTCDTTHTSGDRSYKSFPFYMSTRGYGLYVKTGFKTVFEVGSEYAYNALSFETWQDGLEYIVFFGPSFKEILGMFTELTGRAPKPPLWSFGLWMSRCMYTSRSQLEEAATKLRAEKVPCDVIHIDPAWMRRKHWCDFIWDEKAFPKPEEMLKKLDKIGFKVCLWEQPYVPKDTEMYSEGAKEGFFIKNKKGAIIHIPDFVKSEAAIIDFTNPKAKEWYKQKHINLHRMGVSAFKCDMGDAVPEDAVFYNGKTGLEMHNLYPIYYQGTVYEAAKEGNKKGAIVWGRPGYAGIQRFPVQWSGDSHTTFEDMACVLKGGLSYAISGVPFWSHDVGGFQGPKPSPNLYIRWAQWGLLSSHCRCHGTTPREPWEYGKEVLEIFKNYARLRYSLLPYLSSYAAEASKTGLPIIRPLILEYQNDLEVRYIDLEYLFGPSLLVVPVFNEEGHVDYYLPKGDWLDWWTNEKVAGGQWFTRDVPLDKIPLFMRENSIIPRIKPPNYIGEKPVKEVNLDIWVKDKAILNYSFEDEDFNIKTSKVEGKIVLELGPLKKKWNVRFMKTEKPCGVEIQGGNIESWSYIDSEEACIINLKPSRNQVIVIQTG